MRPTHFFAATFLAAATCAMAAPAAAQDNPAPSLETVLAAEVRTDESSRDQYRRPAETLAFFQVESDMNVVEYGPGGGWYSRVLLPWIAPSGKYMAMRGDSSTLSFSSRAAQVRTMGWPEAFPAAITENLAQSAGDVTAFESDEIPDGAAGTVDRVLVIRSLHSLLGSNVADGELRIIRSLLKDDGMVGVVQHRAPETASFEHGNGSRGYLRQSDVVRLFELHGFELVEASELNANPDDTANWEAGVWTLPPVLRLGEQDRDRYLGIGESDRMTLLFRKRD